jgi:ComF family protein
MTPMLKSLACGLIDIIFPRNCILCRTYVGDHSSPQLCSHCTAGLEFNTPPFCLRCSRHLAVFTPDGICSTCRRYPITFDSAWGAVNYNHNAQQLLHQFKYHQKTAVRHVFVSLLHDFLSTYNFSLESFDYLTPIPLHPVRLRERGFNQSQLLADFVHAETGIPIATTLKRRRPTQIQAHLGPKERWTNMEGAFTISPSFNINNKSILLIDDLLTTGATASAAATTLKAAGASKVGLLVVALAP